MFSQPKYFNFGWTVNIYLLFSTKVNKSKEHAIVLIKNRFIVQYQVNICTSTSYPLKILSPNSKFSSNFGLKVWDMLIDRWLSCTNRNWLQDPNQELTSHMTKIWNKNQMKPLIRPHFTLINKYNFFSHKGDDKVCICMYTRSSTKFTFVWCHIYI